MREEREGRVNVREGRLRGPEKGKREVGFWPGGGEAGVGGCS